MNQTVLRLDENTELIIIVFDDDSPTLLRIRQRNEITGEWTSKCFDMSNDVLEMFSASIFKLVKGDIEQLAQSIEEEEIEEDDYLLEEEDYV